MNQYTPEFFDSLYQHCEGKIEIRILPSRQQFFFDLSDNAGIERCISQNKGANIFFGVGTRDGKAGKKENIVNFPAVWADVDFKDTTKEQLGKLLARFIFKPTIIVLSGNGAHLYWKLSEPAEQSDIEAVEDVNRRIAHALGGDQDATEAARVLRVPGTRNFKYNPPQPVKLHRRDNFKYSLDDFLGLPDPPVKSQYSNKSPVTLEPVKQGSRNVTLARIAGKYIHRGLAKDEVLDLCLGWNCRCNPPQSIEDVVTTVNSIFATHERNGNKSRGIYERGSFKLYY